MVNKTHANTCRGKGYGSALIDFALKQGATKVDVNEQSASALDFYQARGFRIIGRDYAHGLHWGAFISRNDMTLILEAIKSFILNC